MRTGQNWTLFAKLDIIKIICKCWQGLIDISYDRLDGITGQDYIEN